MDNTTVLVSHHETRSGEKHWSCDQCTSTFQRLDHLKRHALTRMFDMLGGGLVLQAKVFFKIMPNEATFAISVALCLTVGMSFQVQVPFAKHGRTHTHRHYFFRD